VVVYSTDVHGCTPLHAAKLVQIGSRNSHSLLGSQEAYLQYGGLLAPSVRGNACDTIQSPSLRDLPGGLRWTHSQVVH
jgi:hypothetical protein